MSQDQTPDESHPDDDENPSEAAQANRAMKRRLEGEGDEDERPEIPMAQEGMGRMHPHPDEDARG